jgi:hypothetical protein
VDDQGRTQWDSAMGANYRLRFPSFDLDIRSAEVVAHAGAPLDRFVLEVQSVPDVESVTVRWRYTNAINDARYQRPLSVTVHGDHKHWSLGAGADVASDTPLAFDLVYTVAGRKHTDDNQGTWYIVSR